MRHLILIAIFCFTVLLSGCSTLAHPGAHFWSYNPQNYQGCTVATYEAKDTNVTWHDCKDKSGVKTIVDLNSDGKPDLEYTATDINGSKAADIRAQVEKAFSDAGVQVAPAAIDGVVKSIKAGLGIP